MKPGVIARYRDHLPIAPDTPALSLGEGDTPLVRCQRLEGEIGCRELHFKLEGCNPTGSFKDRGMVVAVAKALEEGTGAIMCASTGNTSAAAAAYAACSGLEAIIIVPGGNVALGKLAQAILYGARIVTIDGNFDQALSIARDLTERHAITLVNSLNPNRIEGQKTASFEIVDALGDAPDDLFIPVGNAGNVSAYWKGFVEYHAAGKSTSRPRMMGFQAEGAAPIVRDEVIREPKTIATAIRIGNPASWRLAAAAREESGGVIDMVSYEEIMAAYHLLASKAGIFGEPASAASLAGLLKMARAGTDLSGRRVVCVVTGTGLKDPDTALRGAGSFSNLPASSAAVAEWLALA